MAFGQNLDISVKIKKTELIAALEKNKAKHVEDYNKAISVYFDEVADELKKLIKRAKDKDLTADFAYHKHKPINNEANYDKYIGMFNLATEDEIELSTADYDSIVDDNWAWAVQGRTLNMAYSSKFIG